MCNVATAIMALGQLQQGQAAASQASYGAKVAQQNANLAIQQANDVQEQKAQQEQQLQQQKREVRGRQMSAMAGAGIDSSTGSGLDILSDTAYNSQQDINQLEMNAAKQTWGYQQQAENYKSEASAYKASASNANMSGIISAAGTVLSSMNSVSDKWKNNNKYSFKAKDYDLKNGIGKKGTPGLGVNTDFYPKYNNKYKF